MDIIISGPKEGFNRKAALAVTEDCDRVANVTRIVGTSVGDVHNLTEWLRGVGPDAIIFDRVILSPPAMIAAVTAVENYRKQTGRPDVVAVYIEDQKNVSVVLSDSTDFRDIASKLGPEPKVGPMPRRPYNTSVTNEFRDAEKILPRRDVAPKHLDKLWDRCADVCDTTDQRAMLEKLRELLPSVEGKNGSTAAEIMTIDQRCELHEFLLGLLRKYE